jgi:CO/xanthine dehydrogenase Mo-binding subunit
MPAIGQSQRRVDAPGKVTGQTLYPGDINLPDQLFLKVVFARRPHARISQINVREAAAMDGVVTVLTASDVPNNEYGLIMPDQPVLCGPGSAKAGADRVRFIGDQVAVVVAESMDLAARAAKKIEISYEDLPIIADPQQALQDGAFTLHDATPDNILHSNRIRRGDLQAGFEQADVIISGTYQTPPQEHAYLQPEAGVAYIDPEGRVTVEVAGQWAHEDRSQIAHALALPVEQVRVIYPAIGGAFGGREDLSIQIVLALAALKLSEQGIRRPIKTLWSREESIIGHHKRHPYTIDARWGALSDGTLVAAEVRLIEDAGAYAYTSTKVLGNATLMSTGPYDIPNVAVDAFAVYTNNVPGGAFRGFGGPQAAFAAEQQMNKLAEALDMDPVKLRRKNVLREGVPTSVGTPLPAGVSMDEVIAVCAETLQDTSAEPKDEIYIKTGKGLACGFKNIGFSFGFPEQCFATIELHGAADIERVVLRHAGADVGQGAHTVFAQMAAEALGVSIDRVELDMSDTASSGNSGSASASRLTYMSGNAIRGAAEKALHAWDQEERPAAATYEYNPPATTMYDPVTGECTPNFAYGYVAEAAVLDVDTETGHIHIRDLFCVDDVGKVLNQQQIVGQIEGCVVQAAGYTLLENLVQRDGQVLNPYFSTYLIPGILDIPDRVHSILLENPDPNGPWGARGMAEMPYIPFAPAVTAAVHDAIGVWIDEFPLTPERVLKALGRI